MNSTEPTEASSRHSMSGIPGLLHVYHLYLPFQIDRAISIFGGSFRFKFREYFSSGKLVIAVFSAIISK